MLTFCQNIIFTQRQISTTQAEIPYLSRPWVGLSTADESSTDWAKPAWLTVSNIDLSANNSGHIIPSVIIKVLIFSSLQEMSLCVKCSFNVLTNIVYQSYIKHVRLNAVHHDVWRAHHSDWYENIFIMAVYQNFF